MVEHHRDQTSLLEEIRQRLERLESQQLARAIENIDVGQLALDVRRVRASAFPDGYFSGNAWDILLELYQAQRSNKRMRLVDLSADAKMSEHLALRYVDLLMSDGYLYQEEDRAGGHTYIELTSKAIAQVERLFGDIRSRIVHLTHLPEVIESDKVVPINRTCPTG